jgi:hypothetical protein
MTIIYATLALAFLLSLIVVHVGLWFWLQRRGAHLWATINASCATLVAYVILSRVGMNQIAYYKRLLYYVLT